MANEIPIRNIYYMLSYAYDVLKEGENVKLADEVFENIYDLFGKILVNGLGLLIKRGFNREYINLSEELPLLRGKIDINETLKRQNHIVGKLNCEYDELSSNVLFNQIIKASITNLVKYKGIDKQIREKLMNINRYFQDIDLIQLQKQHFSRIRYHRNNRFYRLIIDICELLFDEILVSSQKGETIFKDFIRDGRMAALYEKFILNFYKKELSEVQVYSPIFQWDKDSGFEHVGASFLPIMRTDIVLQNEKEQLIMDAKYYSNALQVRNVGDTKKLISGNLYQIYTYINNSTFTGNKSGMLIYPVVDTDMDFVYSIQGKKIYVKTLNLNTSWENIHHRLIDIAKVI
ncbi:5-methylcytosine-specific restriction enzyme subunit McrC [Desulfitobacterium sp. LBE]|uniref:5-methylcytosine-specific restriction endonuclease system specificity protein McrC n=1 Tax=Desulfitobacterium sp. LBE TaxID=884086 RepID=UPI00119C8CC8|nr:5-methylcytosine-specific restriction endonuclease system specificity protein McrC [Desulfitobacterium sp. LBE]TWH59348.1 5-methylcytosine-specific restriction enzyme subunit McrC [Desulfitobacterium sp. LBE]